MNADSPQSRRTLLVKCGQLAAGGGAIMAAGCTSTDSPPDSPPDDGTPTNDTAEVFKNITVDAGDLVIELADGAVARTAAEADSPPLAVQVRRRIDDQIMFTAGTETPAEGAESTTTHSTPVAREEGHSDDRYHSRSIVGNLAIELINREDRSDVLASTTAEVVPDLDISTTYNGPNETDTDTPEATVTLEITNNSSYPVHLEALETTLSHEAFTADDSLAHLDGLDSNDNIRPSDTVTDDLTASFAAPSPEYPYACDGTEATTTIALFTTPGLTNFTLTFVAEPTGDVATTRRSYSYCDQLSISHDISDSITATPVES